MIPTYSVSEVKALLRVLDLSQVSILEEVCNEEAARFTSIELTAIYRMIRTTKKRLSLNELQLEYLLSFN